LWVIIKPASESAKDDTEGTLEIEFSKPANLDRLTALSALDSGYWRVALKPKDKKTMAHYKHIMSCKEAAEATLYLKTCFLTNHANTNKERFTLKGQSAVKCWKEGLLKKEEEGTEKEPVQENSKKVEGESNKPEEVPTKLKEFVLYVECPLKWQGNESDYQITVNGEEPTLGRKLGNVTYYTFKAKKGNELKIQFKRGESTLCVKKNANADTIKVFQNDAELCPE